MPMEGREPQEKEPMAGKDTGTLGPENSLTKLHRVAKRAKEDRKLRFTAVGHLLDEIMLKEAWAKVRKDGAAGVDGITAKEYGRNLEGNIRSLYSRLRQGKYIAPPVRRAWIPKANGQLRPIGIPTLEDKILQRAAVAIMEVIFEPNFLDTSYGFRPGRNAHMASDSIQRNLTFGPASWVLELDIEDFFGSLDPNWLRKMVNLRLGDGLLRRLIGKWLKAGVLEEAGLVKQEKGTPQGGVVSPLISNIYLHCVLDAWFERKVKPALKGKAHLWRYADDVTLAFEYEEDARKALELIKLRLGKFNLKLNEKKTKLLRFQKPRPDNDSHNGQPPTFNFLGFTYHWGLSRNGKHIVQRKTMASRLSRAISHINQWCRNNRHEPLKKQQNYLKAALRGHYNYYGVTGNARRLSVFYFWVTKVWHKWLSRRSQTGYLRWERMKKILRYYPLEKPWVVHSIYRIPPLLPLAYGKAYS